MIIGKDDKNFRFKHVVHHRIVQNALAFVEPWCHLHFRGTLAEPTRQNKALENLLSILTAVRKIIGKIRTTAVDDSYFFKRLIFKTRQMIFSFSTVGASKAPVETRRANRMDIFLDCSVEKLHFGHVTC